MFTPFFTLNEKMYIFLDETNNVRKITLNKSKNNGLNNENYNLIFVLGGLMFSYNINQEREKKEFIKFFELNKVKLDNENIEIKFNQFANGGSGKDINSLKKLLSSKKINLFLHFLVKKRAYVVYHVIDFFYYIFLDIIESEFLIKEIIYYYSGDFEHKWRIKEFFCDFVKKNQFELLESLYDLGFPCIEDDSSLNQFKKKLINCFNKYIASKESNSFLEKKYIKTILGVINEQDFLFILDYQEKVLISDFSAYYITYLQHFPKSKIILDEEKSIKDKLFKHITRERREMKTAYPRYKFEDSKENFILQLSDIFIGIIKEMYRFCIEYEENQYGVFQEYLRNIDFTEEQKITLRLLSEIHCKSVDFYVWCQKTSIPISAHERFFDMLKLCKD